MLNDKRAELLGVLVGIQFHKIVDDIAEGRAYVMSHTVDYGDSDCIKAERMELHPVTLDEYLEE